MMLAVCFLAAAALVVSARAAVPEPTRKPIRVVLDLAKGETQTATLARGKPATIRLVDSTIPRDSLRGAVRSSAVTIEANGKRATIDCGNYRLPTAIGGVWIDCPIVKAYYENTNHESWCLDKDARIRAWPTN